PMADRHPERGPCRPLKVQKVKQPQRAGVACKSSPPVQEHPRVRCWNCRAFGHKASRCPLKHWNRSPVPQAMGSNMMKENLKPWNPQVQRNPGRLNRAARKTEQRAWHEEQREAPCWRRPWRPTQRPQQNWKEETEPCDYVSVSVPRIHTCRDPIRTPRGNMCKISPLGHRKGSATPIKGVERSACLPPVPKNGQEVPVTDSPHAEGTHFVQDPSHSVHEGDNRPHSAFSTQDLDQALIHQPQAKFPDGNSHSIQHAAAHSVGQDSDLIIKVPGKRAAQTSSQTYQKPTKKTRLSPSLKSTQRPDLQPQHKGHLIKTLQPCHVPPFSPIPKVPGQPLRMVFTTLEKGQWSSRCMTPPSLPPAEMLTAAAQIPSTTEKSEALCPCVSLSVLFEALQLSSSSKKVMANET
uniref:CCHC-type domain-containing protein n=1 Tax=Myotis lucifugus TaxID=59463 RepID=G1P3A7_MYOLU